HVASSFEAETLPAIYGRATAAMEVSRTSMNVANMTEIAISHGLADGRQFSEEGATGSFAAISFPRFDVLRRNARCASDNFQFRVYRGRFPPGIFSGKLRRN